MSYYNSHYKYIQKKLLSKRVHNSYLQRIIDNGFSIKKKDAKICDIGCSTGEWLRFLQYQGFTDLCGVDIDKVSINKAKRKNPSIEFYREDLLSFVKRSVRERQKYDLITLFSVVEHLELDTFKYFLMSIRKMTIPSGIILLRFPNAGTIYNNHWLYDDITHKGFYTAKSISQLIRLCGFSSDEFSLSNDSAMTKGLIASIRPFAYLFFQVLDLLLLDKSISNKFQYPSLIVIINSKDEKNRI